MIPEFIRGSPGHLMPNLMRPQFFALLMLASFLAIGQSQTLLDIEIDSRLLEVYDKPYLDQLKQENPVLLQRWSYYLDNAFYLTDTLNESAGKNYPIVVIKDLKKINILLLEKQQQLKRNWSQPTIYKISNSNKYLVYFSGKQFTERMKQTKGKN